MISVNLIDQVSHLLSNGILVGAVFQDISITESGMDAKDRSGMYANL